MALLVSLFRPVKVDTPRQLLIKKRQTAEAIDPRAMRRGQIADIRAGRQGKGSSEQL